MPKRLPDWRKITPAIQAYLARKKDEGLTQEDVGRPYHLSGTQMSNLNRGSRRSSSLSHEVQAFVAEVMGGEIPYVDGELDLAALDPALDAGGQVAAPRKLALAAEPGQNYETELQRALDLVRQLYRLKTHKPPYREHDWKVLMALLEAPAESDRPRDHRRTRKE